MAEFHLSRHETNLWLFTMVLSQICGALLAGYLIHHLGCVPTMRISLLLMISGLLIKAEVSWNLWSFLPGVVLCSMALALNVCSITQYVSEISRKATRGFMCVLIEIAIVAGAVLLNMASFLLVGPDPTWWRHVLEVSLVIPVVALLVSFLGMLESPRYLQRVAGADEAASVLARILGTDASDPEVREASEGWREEAKENAEGSYLARARQVVSSRGGQASLLVHLGQGICGAAVFGGFVGIILEEAGMSPKQAQGAMLAGVIASFAATAVVLFFLIDSLGRRPLLLGSAAGMGVVFLAMLAYLHVPCFICGISFWYLAILMIIGRVMFSIGFGPITYVYAPELLPNNVRSSGLGLGKVMLQTGILVSVNGGLELLYYSKTLTYAIFACINAALLAAVYLLCPETRGMALEQQRLGSQPSRSYTFPGLPTK